MYITLYRIYLLIEKFFDWYFSIPIFRYLDRLSTGFHTKLVRNEKTYWISVLLRRLDPIHVLLGIKSDIGFKLDLYNINKPMYFDSDGNPVFSASSMDDFTESQWTTLPR